MEVSHSNVVKHSHWQHTRIEIAFPDREGQDYYHLHRFTRSHVCRLRLRDQ